jgi:hypothetical protein
VIKVDRCKSTGLQETKKNNAHGRETLLTGDSQNLSMEEMIHLDALGAGKPTKILSFVVRKRLAKYLGK